MWTWLQANDIPLPEEGLHNGWPAQLIVCELDELDRTLRPPSIGELWLGIAVVMA